jgi:Flp pilus assembly protein TadD
MPGVNKQKLEQFGKGQLRFTQIFNFDAQQIASLLICGHNYFSQGKLQEAKKIFEGLAVLDPNNPYINSILGAIYQGLEQHDVAILRYTSAINVFPQDIVSLTNRAEIYLNQGKFVEASEDLRKIIQLDPQRQNPSANRARVLVALTTESLEQIKQRQH